jgi:hypothetical protein
LTQSWATTVFSGLSDNFSVAWSGWIYLPVADYYRFQTDVDGGVRIILNGAVLLDQWAPAAASYTSSWTGTPLPVGWYPITVLFNDTTGTASINVMSQRWNSGASPAFAAIPTTNLGH